MASTGNASTPERSPPAVPHAVRRSYTAPTKLSHSKSGSVDTAQPSPDTGETLFVHTGARIVSFKTPPRTTVRNASFTDPGTLSWRSVTERTLAAGPLRIQKVPGSVSFLDSGTFLKAILPRSQCWCVDQNSTFVLRVGQDSYYRIELPNNTTLDKEKIEEIKSVFDKVLLYEKTASPFHSSTSDDLPEEPETPTPRGRLKPTGRARKWKLDKVRWRPEDGDGYMAMLSDQGSPERSDSDASLSTSTSIDTHEAPVSSGAVSPEPEVLTEEEIKPLSRPKIMAAMRSVTAPPQLTLQQSSLPSRQKESDEEAPSLSSSIDSFHSANSQIYHQANDELKFRSEETEDEQTPTFAPPSHSRNVSEITVTVEPDAFPKPVYISSPLDDDVEGSVPSTPTLLSDTDEHSEPQGAEVVTPPNSLRLRDTRKPRYRSVSPYSQDATALLTNTRTQNQGLTTTIIRKTFEILISPPGHLYSIMLRIAARIAESINLATAEWPPPSKNRIPCSWESEEEGIDWDEEEDYAFRLKPLGPPLDRNSN